MSDETCKHTDVIVTHYNFGIPMRVVSCASAFCKQVLFNGNELP